MLVKIKCGLLMPTLITATLVLTGCIGSKPYQSKLGARPNSTGELPVLPHHEIGKCATPEKPGTCVAFVEYDDYGNLMNREQLSQAETAARQMAANEGTVLVYVHGWHNSADEDNSGDVGEFRELVNRISELDQQRRPSAPGHGKVLGIYVGWRGESISSKGPSAPFSYLLTFWGRKSAAQEIGNSAGVHELFEKLTQIRVDNQKSRLIIHGHSFGAAVVYSTLQHTLVSQIIADRKGEAARENAADLIVLLNPAFEAIRVRPLYDLGRTQEYDESLPPRLVVLTTEADWATKITFPIGRFFSTFADAYADDQSYAENKTALGHHIPFVTHQLARSRPGECSSEKQLRNEDRVKNVLGLAEPQFISDRDALCVFPGIFSDAVPLTLRRCDGPASCSIVGGDHFLKKGAVADGAFPRRFPIMNIRTTHDVSTGHTDIRNHTMENFVSAIIALSITYPSNIPLRKMQPEK